MALNRDELARDIFVALIRLLSAQSAPCALMDAPAAAVEQADALLAALAPRGPQQQDDRAARLLAAADEFKRRYAIYHAEEETFPPTPGLQYRGSEYLKRLWSWVCQAESILSATAHGVEWHWPRHFSDAGPTQACRLDDPQPQREERASGCRCSKAGEPLTGPGAHVVGCPVAAPTPVVDCCAVCDGGPANGCACTCPEGPTAPAAPVSP